MLTKDKFMELAHEFYLRYNKAAGTSDYNEFGCALAELYLEYLSSNEIAEIKQNCMTGKLFYDNCGEIVIVRKDRKGAGVYTCLKGVWDLY